jgi:hypothetical protein
VRKAADHFVGSVARVATLGAGHEHLLLHLRWKQGGPALRTKLQNLFSREQNASARIYPLS